MTTPSKPPVDDQDYIKLEELGDRVSDGSDLKPVTGSPPRETTGMFAAHRRPSTTSERELDKPEAEPCSHDALGGSELGGSSCSMCSDKFKSSSSHLSSDDSYQPGTGDDCAALLLSCLYCRFHELMALLPDTCERAVSRCFPSYKYIMAASEWDEQGQGCCGHKLELDCNFFDSCKDAGDLVELAMEISEVCYR
ncbi:myoD family inhibitor domain-containing protein 2-like [Hippoglossus hippoglossus]|uniref:myoD family inhibitor domain-containing protein 2-like n=1 Tax=Hippoglossus hippoglossus TaxID=8267 RepID=UPI00148C6F72|nr:myoD family inhibitor domain-containing protein 2-like [Hippoglossus hippoglossus]XP_034446082.1 myoD family inhibitor domain-containing protein 2-like [Hippoglossus hippoglossus]XP_035015835.1 myoD family inhibitor domain-containing protein 2-like [Hippoglossus stenolepis]